MRFRLNFHNFMFRSNSLSPFDRWIIGSIIGLSLLIGFVLIWGDQTIPRVRSFNWNNQVVEAKDRALLFTFSRPMDRASVEAHFQLSPAIPGKFSWAGRRMAYTLDYPAPYGQQYTVSLVQAQDYFQKRSIPDNQPFLSQFRSRDRAFVYLGVQGEEESRLILYNLTRQEKQILTPPDLVVVDFEPYPKSDRILFSATDRVQYEQGQFDLKIYSVTTGIEYSVLNSRLPDKPDAETDRNSPKAGEVKLLIESDTYQNLKFDLSPDGKTILVQRANKEQPGVDFGLWILREQSPLEPFKTQPGGDFLITPDSQSMVISQGQGVAVIPLNANSKSDGEPLDFLPQFGRVLSLSPNGREAAMIRFNTDYTRSLFLVTNQGQQVELWKTKGSIFNATFDPSNRILYCLGSQLLPTEAYQEEPILLAIDLTTAISSAKTPEEASNALPDSILAPLLRIPNQREIFTSLSPDGLALLFDQLELTPDKGTDSTAPRSSDSQLIHNSRLWILPLIPDRFQQVNAPLPTPEALPMSGLRPQWLP